jgi:hypothetical protein
LARDVITKAAARNSMSGAEMIACDFYLSPAIALAQPNDAAAKAASV